MTREQLEEMAAEYAKINNNIFSNSTEERIKLGFIKGYEKAQEQLKNCGNCNHGRELFDNGCLGCKIADHTKWEQRQGD